MLIVEDGTGRSDAESYASLAEANAYHEKNSNPTWDRLDSEVQESALRKASQYIDSMYRFRGERSFSAQAMMWPRSDVVVDGVYVGSQMIPLNIKAACCELALRAAASSLFSDVGMQYVTEVQVGPIKRTMSAVQNGGQKRYAVVDALLRDYILGGSGSASIRLVRG